MREKQRTSQLAAHQPAANAVAQQQSVQLGVQSATPSAAGQTVRVSVATTPVASSTGASGLTAPAQAVVVGISQPMQQQQQQPGQIVAVSQMNSTAAARQTVVPNQQTAVNVSGVLSRIQTSAATTLAAGQIVVTQAGGKSTLAGAQAGTLQLGRFENL